MYYTHYQFKTHGLESKIKLYFNFFFLLHLVVFIYVIYSAWCILIVYL